VKKESNLGGGVKKVRKKKEIGGQVKKEVQKMRPMTRTELEIRTDENKILTPRCSKPFSSYSQAIDRLLPYHVNQQYGDVNPSDIAQDGEVFRDLCHGLMERTRKIQEKLSQSFYRKANLGIPNSERLLLERLWAEDNCDMKPPRYDIHGQPLTTSIFSGDQTNSRPISNLHYSPKPGGQAPGQNHDKMNPSTGSAIKYTTTPVSKTTNLTNSTHFTNTPGYSNLDTNRKTEYIKSTTDNNKKYNYTDNDSDNNNRNSKNNNASTLFFYHCL